MMRHLMTCQLWYGTESCYPGSFTAAVRCQVEELVPDALGFAGQVYEHVLGEEKYTFIEDVKNPHSCTILVKVRLPPASLQACMSRPQRVEPLLHGLVPRGSAVAVPVMLSQDGKFKLQLHNGRNQTGGASRCSFSAGRSGCFASVPGRARLLAAVRSCQQP